MTDANATFAPTSSLAVARFFIAKAAEAGRTLTPMQLLKLVYIAHGWSLCFFNRDLITHHVEAWQYGPVIPEVYQAVKAYGGGAIDASIVDRLPSLEPDVNRDALLDAVYENYKQYSGPQLSTMTHRAGTPWDITWNQNGGKTFRDMTIDRELIRSHYNELRQKNLADA